MELNQIITKQDLHDFEKRLQQLIEKIINTSSKSANGEWLRNKDLKEMLGISDGTIQNLRVNGTLPYTKLGGIYYYRYSDVTSILQTNLKKN